MPLSQTVMTLIRGIAKARKRRPFKREASKKGGPRAERTGPKSRNRGKFPHYAGWEAAGKAFEFQAGAEKCVRAVGTLGNAGEGRNAATH